MTVLNWVLVVAALALAAALVVYRERVRAMAADLVRYLSDVVAEMKKITWPTRLELRKATMVILVFVILVSIVIGVMDIILQGLLVRLPARIS